MYYVLHTSTCYYIVEQFYTYSHTIVASTYVLATIGFDANEKEPSKVCRQQHTNPTPWVMTSALETVHKFLCGRTVRNVDKCEALAVLGIFVRHVEEVVIIIAQPDVVKQPDHLVNTEPLRYWSFRALLPNSHASSQVDEYRKRIRKNWRNGLLAFSAICESSGSDYSRVTKNISGENRMLQFNHVEWDSSLFFIVGSANAFELCNP